MKNRLWTLVKGELDRLNKYGVFSISILVAFIWGAVLFVVSDNILALFLPMVLFLDATMMSIMYIGAEMHFEKTESTISTMLVTPVTNAQMVASKVIANTIHNLTSSLLIIGAFYLAGKMEWVMDPGINLPIVLLGVVVATSTFTIRNTPASRCIATVRDRRSMSPATSVTALPITRCLCTVASSPISCAAAA